MEEAKILVVEMLRDLTMVSPRTVRLVMALLIASGCWAVVARSWTVVPAWLTLAFASLVWLRVDQRDEGRVLYVLSSSHGLTQADLLVPAVAGGALVLRVLRALMARWWDTNPD